VSVRLTDISDLLLTTGPAARYAATEREAPMPYETKAEAEAALESLREFVEDLADGQLEIGETDDHIRAAADDALAAAEAAAILARPTSPRVAWPPPVSEHHRDRQQ
jgi:hypothetical protein